MFTMISGGICPHLLQAPGKAHVSEVIPEESLGTAWWISSEEQPAELGDICCTLSHEAMQLGGSVQHEELERLQEAVLFLTLEHLLAQLLPLGCASGLHCRLPL